MADPPSDEADDGTQSRASSDGDAESPTAHDSATFAPPRAAPHVIALEPEWERARADKQAGGASPRPPEPAPRRGSGGWIVAIAAIAGAVAAGVWLLHRRQPARHARLPGIEIRVRADPPAEIRIDGHRAGKTPLTLQRRAGATPIRIEATIRGTVQTRVVVPDRDQEVDFAP